MSRAEKMSSKTAVIAAGGSGGHIYPALAVADRLKKSHPDLLIFFVGTEGGLENKIIPPKGYPLLHIPIGRLNKNVATSERVMTLLKMPLAFFKAAWICLKLRPRFLLGVGGHASGPMLLMASLMGFKTYIWEPNAFPGMANRYLSRFVKKIFVVFDQAARRLGEGKAQKVGYPMRESIEALGHLAVKESEPEFHVLVFGGSQGAQSINSAVLDLVKTHAEALLGVKILLQCGSRDFGRVSEIHQSLSTSAKEIVSITEFIYDMEEKYKWADVVIARSGMGAVSELSATGTPSILIPLASSADGHQQKNAEALQEKGAAIMVLQKQLSPEELLKHLMELKNDVNRRRQMSEAARGFYQPRGAEVIADNIVSGAQL